jgi:3-phenylpropionate/trans-cinnamate dioxygenase ferredoxin reductase subunit
VERLIVVGGGLGGLESIRALRELEYSGRITLVSAERHLPYDRPPLSKEVLRGEVEHPELEADWDDFDVELRLGSPATALREGTLETERGPLDFDGLVIATGASPVRLPGAEGLHVLRTIEDAHALRNDFRAGARVLIIGAGWIGAEVATAAANRGAQVTVVEALEAPIARGLGETVGSLTSPWYAEAGIDLLLGVSVASVGGGTVALSSGDELDADCVVCGIGVRPETAWLQGSGVDLDPLGRVLVDESLATSQPGVVAVGDCTSWRSTLYGRHLHVEHWDNALRAPAVAAATLLGHAATYDPVPYFWSDQLGRHLQYVGHHEAEDELLFRGDPKEPTWSGCWLSEGRLAALVAVGRPRDVSHGRRVISSRAGVDVERLADPDVPVVDAVDGS